MKTAADEGPCYCVFVPLQVKATENNELRKIRLNLKCGTQATEENDSPYTGYKLRVNPQNRNTETCSFAKSARLQQETSALINNQQTSTTSEIPSLLRLGPNRVYKQGALLFLLSGTMSSQQLIVTMLFRQLEVAIANGHHKKAAALARELALHKVACSLTSLNISKDTTKEEPIMVNLYIEDKDIHQGPFPLLVHHNMTLGALKSKIEKEFALPIRLQRWILGKRLVTDDNTTLQDCDVTETGCSVFLYLICCDSSENHNSLLENLPKLSKNLAMQKLWGSNDINFHEENKDNDLPVQGGSDIENILQTNNTNEDEDFSDNEDSDLINSTSISPISNIECDAEDLGTDESESHRDILIRHFISDAEEAEVIEEHVSEHLFHPDLVTARDSYFKNENALICCEQNENEVNNNQINKLNNDTNKEIIHLKIENVHNHLVDNAVVAINKFEDDNGEFIKEEQTVELPSTGYILITKEKQSKMIEKRLQSYHRDAESTDTAFNFTSDAERKQVSEKNEFQKTSSEYINQLNKEELMSGQRDDFLKHENTQTVVFPTAFNQNNIEFEKQEEIKDEEEEHGYLPNMEYIPVINEFDAEVEEQDNYEENEIKPLCNVNYALPITAIMIEEKMEDLHKTEYIQIQMPHILMPIAAEREQNATEKHEVEAKEEQHEYFPNMEFIAVINEFDTQTEKEEHYENQIEHNSADASVSCDSPHEFSKDACKLAPDVKYPIDRSGIINKTAETLLGSVLSSNEEITDYEYMMQLDSQDLIPNAESFSCPVCFTTIHERQGVVLRDCLHQFCKECLAGSVEHAESTIIKCPFRNEEYSCNSHLQEREIKAVVTAEVFGRYVHRCLIAAESRADNSFHCKMPDCPGWVVLDDPVGTFQCPTCSVINCLKCQAIHEGINCQQYQDELEYQHARNEELKETKNYLDNMVEVGKAMLCPKCKTFVIKRWGCDWIKCPVCMTEICWVTKKARWGPEGRGDVSGGCRCGVNGKRCHPKCNFCH